MATLKSSSRNFLLLCQGQFVSFTGTAIAKIALALLIVDLTDSPAFMGVVMMCATGVDLLCTPLSGAIADRFCRRNLIVFCDLCSGLLSLAFAGLILYAQDAVLQPAILLYAMGIGVFASLFSPSVNALIPDIVPSGNLSRANAILMASFRISTLLGKGAAGPLYRLAGAPLLFLIDGLTFLLSAVSQIFIRPDRKPGNPNPPAPLSPKSLLEDIRQGWQVVFDWPGLRTLIILSAGINFFFEPLFVILPFHVSAAGLGDASRDWYGYLLGSLGLGTICGYWLTAFLRPRLPGFGLLALGGLILQGVLYAVLGLTHSALLFLGIILLLGLLSGAFGNLTTSLLQQEVPAELRGRVFSLFTTLTLCASPLSLGISGLLVELCGRQMAILFIASGIAMSCLAIWAFLHPHFRCLILEIKQD